MITIKTKEDIAILREGGRRHAEIMRALEKMIEPGLDTREIDETVLRLIGEFAPDKSALLGYKPYGAKRPYPASICVSVNDEVVHGIPTENSRLLEEGDIVSLDFALVHQGLVTDMAITVPVGNISTEILGLLETTKAALMAGIKAAKNGNQIGDVSAAIERVGRGGRGYGIVEELVGHGVGYGVHEDPYVPNYISGVKGGKNNKGDLLKQGMVLAFEPMFNLGSKDVTIDPDGYTIRTADGLPSAHFEHTVLITKSGAEILTA